MNDHPAGYTVRPCAPTEQVPTTHYCLDTPVRSAHYLGMTEASLWAVARKLEREKLIA